MFTEISSALTSIKAAADLARTLVSAGRDAAVREKAAELREVIFDLQDRLLALQARVAALQQENPDLQLETRKLKEQVEQNDAWNEQARRYELAELGAGSYAYLYKGEDGDGVPAHKACAACFEKKQKSLLQRSSPGVLECHACGSLVHDPSGGSPPPPPVVPLEKQRGF